MRMFTKTVYKEGSGEHVACGKPLISEGAGKLRGAAM